MHKTHDEEVIGRIVITRNSRDASISDLIDWIRERNDRKLMVSAGLDQIPESTEGSLLLFVLGGTEPLQDSIEQYVQDIAIGSTEIRAVGEGKLISQREYATVRLEVETEVSDPRCADLTVQFSYWPAAQFEGIEEVSGNG